ncbi:uncharacterized protein LOC127008328 isoform X2 [Eriocheir sinensis]|uniref:uncharacterized protein LOC127008328 isoform X2 n=1 Tax=Eriocheir sinensis TaxID=95602 RepID=UPI0021CA06F5|nr:uncharacterized protein LOC127008328 isoform X2 [Eriocheir sinensis]
MAGQTSMVLWGLRVVLTCFKAIGGFPYSWDDTIAHVSSSSRNPSPTSIFSPNGNSPGEVKASGGSWYNRVLPLISQSRDSSSACPPHGGSTPREGGVSGFWAWSSSKESSQQICPRLKRARWHRVWAAGMGVVYLLAVSVFVYDGFRNGLPRRVPASEAIYFIMDVVTMVVLATLLLHMLLKSDHLAALVSHLDTLPPGPSLDSWAPTYAAHIIPLLALFLASLCCTMTLFSNVLRPLESWASILRTTVTYATAYVLTYVILALYNSLLYLLYVILATRMRDLRIALEDIRRERRDRGGKGSVGEDLRQRVGPVLCDLWHAQMLLNASLGAPILLLMAEMVIGTISNGYYILSEARRNIQSVVYLVNDSVNLMYLCHAPALMHDQLEEMRYMMKKWRMETTDSRTEKELTHLLDLLDSYPSFSVSGYYVLSRARLVDIMSFSATYLVVLLQFHMGERTDDAPATPTPTPAPESP